MALSVVGVEVARILVRGVDFLFGVRKKAGWVGIFAKGTARGSVMVQNLLF